MRQMIAVLVFLSVSGFFVSIYYLIKDRRDSQKRRLIRGLIQENRHTNGSQSLMKTTMRQTRLTALVDRIIDIAEIERFIQTTGAAFSVDRFLAVTALCGFFAAFIGWILFNHGFFAPFFCIAGMFIPFLYLRAKRRKRETALVEQLPEALDMIARALKVGQSVDQSLVEVGNALPPPMGSEVRKMYEELHMGLPFESTLRHFEARYPRLFDVKIMTAAFIIQRETGGNLTGILEGLSKTIRNRFNLERQIKTLTAEGRSSATILGILPIAFAGLMWFFKPDYIRTLFAHPKGQLILAAAVIFEISGFIVMRWMTRIDS